MSLIESATSSYAETVTTAVPLHRAALFLVSSLLFLANRAKDQESLFAFLWSTPTSQITSTSSNLLGQSVVGDLISAFGVVASSVMITKICYHLLFALALRSTSILEKLKSAKKDAELMSFSSRKEAIDLAKSSLEAPGKRIRSANRMTEFVCGIALQTLVMAISNTMLELFTGLLLAFFFLGLLIHSVRLFISEYFGLAMYIANLEGKPTPNPNTIN